MGCIFSKTSEKYGDHINSGDNINSSSRPRRHGGPSTGPSSISKKSGDNINSSSRRRRRGGSFSGSSSSSQINIDLTSYDAASQHDPVLQSYDAVLKDRISRVIDTLASRALSSDSFQKVTDCLVETNEEVVQFILENKTDIWENQDLFVLVQEYFESSLLTLDFCTALEKCLERARDSHGIVQAAMQQFEQEQREKGIDGEREHYARTLQELKNIKAAGDPFKGEFNSLRELVDKQQDSMLKKLQDKQGKVDMKLKRIDSWRKVSNVIFGATLAALLICSVVAAAIAAPPVVTALAAAASVPLGSMGTWVNSLLSKYENELKRDREIVTSMKNKTYVTNQDLKTIKALVDRLGNHMNDLVNAADSAITQKEEAVVFAMDDIRKAMGEFEQTINNLGDRADKFRVHIKKARTQLMEKIIMHHGNS